MPITRRDFMRGSGLALAALALRFNPELNFKLNAMSTKKKYDVIIIGGSYSGMAAGMALERALKEVLIIDGNMPCNRQTPFSHNFLTQDGKSPGDIAAIAKKQVEMYGSVTFLSGIAKYGTRKEKGFEIETESGEKFTSHKLIFATGIKDIMPDIPGFADCWGISVLHCPYCHGYEVRNERTGILGNGDFAFEFSALLSNWTKDLSLFTNGKSTLTKEQREKFNAHNIKFVESAIERLEHTHGKINQIIFKDGSAFPLKALYAPIPFEQHCSIPESLGCELSDEGYIKTDSFQKTSVPGVYACGDNTTRLRTVANAVAMGTSAGMMLNKEMVLEGF